MRRRVWGESESQVLRGSESERESVIVNLGVSERLRESKVEEVVR